MKICGFTIVRNGVKYQYPFLESITSLLPIVDELYINVGNGDDNTLDLIRKISDKKIKIFTFEWDMSNRVGGKVLADETNRIMELCKGDWGVYLQADEIFHEADYEKILNSIRSINKTDYDGLSFRYLHFEGTYDYVNPFRYRREVRIVRLNRGIISWGDAAGFRYGDGRRLKVKKTNIKIYHYGWVRSPKEMIKKRKEFEKLYHDDEYVTKKYMNIEKYMFPNIDVCYRFKGSHPSVMKNRIERIDWEIKPPKRIPLFLNPKAYKILLHKWGILKGDWNWK